MSSPITLISDFTAPPPGLLEEIAQAAAAYDELYAGGHALAFTPGGAGERVAVEVCDTGGNVLETLSIADALEVAAGRPLR